MLIIQYIKLDKKVLTLLQNKLQKKVIGENLSIFFDVFDSRKVRGREPASDVRRHAYRTLYLVAQTGGLKVRGQAKGRSRCISSRADEMKTDPVWKFTLKKSVII